MPSALEVEVQQYRPGMELVVPPYAADGEQDQEFVFMVAEVLDRPAPPGFVHVRGRIGADSWNSDLRLPLGLQRATQGVLYGLHAYSPTRVRPYVLASQGPGPDAAPAHRPR